MNYLTLENILMIGAAQGAFLGIVIMIRKARQAVAGRLLAALIFLLSISLLYTILYTKGFNWGISYHWFGWTIPMPLLFGPLFFLYVKKENGLPLTKKEFWHFLPFLLENIVLGPFFLKSQRTKMMLLEGELWHPLYNINVLENSYLMHGLYLLAYFVLIIYLMKRECEWTATIPVLFGILIIPYFAQVFSQIMKLEISFVHAFAYTRIPLIYTLGFLAFRYKGLESHPSKANKYGTTQIDEGKMIEVRNRLLELMGDEKLFLDPEIRLISLAAQLSINPQHLSRVINQCFGKSFSDFVNEHRVNEACRLIDEQPFGFIKMSYLGFQVGFNSKTSFFNSFKKFKGQPPREYQRKNR